MELTPLEVNHEPVWSVDSNPTDPRQFVSAGPKGCYVWERKGGDLKSKGEISSLGASVNCVRWSPDGKLLATAAGSAVQILKRKASTLSHKDEWNRIAVGNHNLDCVGVSWAPDSQGLASCGMDSCIILWEVTSNGLKQKHKIPAEGAAKGVSWDPAGQYLAYQDEKKLAVLDLKNNRNIELSCSKYYNSNSESDASYFTRLSWSPQGLNLLGVSAKQGSSHVGLLFARDKLHKEPAYVSGHPNSLVASLSQAWNPQTYKNPKGEQFQVYAVGCAENLTVWSTGSPRPIVLLKEQKGAILDLTWTPDGSGLIAASTTGACLLSFTQKFGTLVVFKQTTPKPAAVVPKLALSEKKSLKNSMSTREEETVGSQDTSRSEEEDEDETRTEGSRSSQNSSESVDDIEDSELEEKEKEIVTKLSPSKHQPKAVKRPSLQVFESKSGGEINQTVTVGPGGKKRLTPQYANSSQAPTLNEYGFPTTNESPPISDGGRDVDMIEIPADDPPKKKKQTNNKETKESKKRGREDDHSPRGEKSTSSYKKRKLEPKASEKEKKKDNHEEPAPPRSTKSTKVSKNNDIELLPTPKPTKQLAKEISENQFGNRTIVEANIISIKSSTVQCTIANSKPPQVLWKDNLKSSVTAITGNSQFIAIGCLNGDLCIYTPGGRRMFPILKLGPSAIHTLSSSGDFLLAVSCSGTVTLWNMRIQKKLFTAPLFSLLQTASSEQPKKSMLEAQVDQTGAILVAISDGINDGQAYTFSQDMNVWMRIFDNSYPLSEHQTFLHFWNKCKGPLMKAKMMGQGADRNTSAKSILSLTSPNSQRDIDTETISHLENQIASAIILASKDEYLEWLIIYVKKDPACCSSCASAGTCLGRNFPLSYTNQLEKTVLGLQKREVYDLYILPELN